MYNPEHFVESDPAKIAEIIEQAPLAILTAHTKGEGLVAHHVPLLMDGEDKLIGHIAAMNPLHEQVSNETDVLAVFRLDNAYISPNWYPSKKIDGKQVPTWNYRIVHISGKIHFYHDEKKKRAIVGKLTKHFESRTNGTDGWKMADAPNDYMTSQLSKIVGFEIDISTIKAKSKLNQNKTAEDRFSVADELNKRGLNSIAEAMKKRP